MVKLSKIYIDYIDKNRPAIRAEWDNGRSQRIELEDLSPFYVERGLWMLQNEIHKEQNRGNI